MTTEFEILPQQPQDQPGIEDLLDQAFGIARRTKTSYRLREGERPVPGLSFVARETGPRHRRRDQLLGAAHRR